MIKEDLDKVFISVIKPEFIFFKIEGKMFGINPVAFEEKLLGVAPEALDSVDVTGALGEVFLMIDRKVFSEALEVAVAGKFIGVEDGTLHGIGLDFAHKGFLGAVGHDHRTNPAVALQEPEYRHFTSRTASAPPLAATTKIRLIDFDLAEQFTAFSFGQIGKHLSESTECRIGRWIGYSDTLGCMIGTGLEHKRTQQRPLPLLLCIAPLSAASRALPLAA